MRILAILILVLSLCSPAFAYRIDAVQVEIGKSVSSDTVKLSTTARVLGNSLSTYKVILTTHPQNTESVWVGNSDVRVNQGLLLVSGTQVSIDVDNLNKIYGISNGGTQFINYITENQ